MINIAKRKLPPIALATLVYISYCAANWFVMRGNMAYIAYQSDMGWLANDAWAFFIGGLLSLALYEVIASVVTNRLRFRIGGDVQSLRYGLDLTVIAANVVLFLLKLIYLAVPLYAPVIDIMLDPIVTLGFVAVYCLYAFHQNYVEKSRFRMALTQIMGGFLAVYGIVALVELIVTVA